MNYFFEIPQITPFGVGLARKALFSNMQKITCATFNGYSLMIVSFYQKLHKLFFSLVKNVHQ